MGGGGGGFGADFAFDQLNSLLKPLPKDDLFSVNLYKHTFYSNLIIWEQSADDVIDEAKSKHTKYILTGDVKEHYK